MRVWKASLFVALSAIIASGCSVRADSASGSAVTITGPSTAPVDTVLSVTPSAFSMQVGTCALSTTFSILSFTNPLNLPVIWSASNGSAKVDSKGVVTALAAGVDTITAKVAGKPTVTATVIVTVTACPSTSSGIRVILQPLADAVPSGSGCLLFHQQTQNQVLPVGTSQAVTFSVAPAGIINVDGFGLVSAATPGISGSVILTARSVADPTASASITVIVANVPCTGTSNSNVNVNVAPSIASGLAGQTLQLTKTVQNSSAVGAWTSSDTTKVKVDQSGLATFMGVGSAHVCYTVTSVSGCALLTTTTASNLITVSINTPKGTTMHVGDTQLLSVTTNATDPTIDWLSSAPYWCDVNIQTSILTAKGTGTCTIYASLRNNPTGASAGQITITVVP